MINVTGIFDISGLEVTKCVYRSTKDMSQMHYHNHYEILYICDNMRTLIVNENRYTLDRDTIALIPPFIPHLTISGGVLPEQRITVDFYESYIHGLCSVLTTDILNCFSTPCTVMNIGSIREKVWSVLQDLQESREETERLLLVGRLLCLLSAHAPQPTSNKCFNEMIRYIEGNYHEKITLDLLAEKFFLSRYTVSRYFAKYAGISMPHYLNTIRVINAKRYLRNGMKVTEVAFRCGFESTTNFDRVFRRHEGMSPSEFQKI